MTAEEQKAVTLSAQLVAWFRSNARDLPWRHTTDPYAVLVSEVMLQQTQVKTVVPYWKRWMRVLPNVKALAGARPERIHKLWEGLGYYTRVRNLQKAAQQIIAEHGGRFPRDYDAVLALPGVGRYTAGAVCSIAFGLPTPVVDGNVIRVLARVYGIGKDPRERKTNERLWELAGLLVTASGAPSDLNQSLMELGSLVCRPVQPACESCPIGGLCVARARGWQDRLPRTRRRPGTTRRRFVALLARSGGRFLARQRPDGTVNGHLWEFPNLEIGARRFSRAWLRNAAERLAGGPVGELTRVCTVQHSITRYRITVEAYLADVEGERSEGNGRWLTIGQLRRLAFPSAHRRLLKQAAEIEAGSG